MYNATFNRVALFFLKNINMYTIGLVPYNMNPWLVSYSFPVATNNIFIQYFQTSTKLELLCCYETIVQKIYIHQFKI